MNNFNDPQVSHGCGERGRRHLQACNRRDQLERSSKLWELTKTSPSLMSRFSRLPGQVPDLVWTGEALDKATAMLMIL